MAKGGNPTRTSKGKGPNSGNTVKRAGSRPDDSNVVEPNVPIELQQRCLNIFRDALQPDDQDATTVQEVKGHLYNRNFATAFGKEEYLRVYASRWSPSRALGYLQVFNDIEESILPAGNTIPLKGEDGSAYNIVCLGGGAGAELVGLAGWLSELRESLSDMKLRITLIDIAYWGTTVNDLHKRIVTPPELSKYASAAAKEANKVMLPEETLEASFLQQDVLEWPEEDITKMVGDAKLVTLLFTLNELYSTNVPKTQRLLSHLTSLLRPDAFLLVVDSPGNYSTVSINGAEKKYPMQWLLDYTLLGSEQKVGGARVVPKWEKVLSDDSRWFRMPQGLRYPIELENMRYQVHLYRRLGEGEEREQERVGERERD